MTAAGDYVSAEENQELETGPAYPVVFGTELTPMLQGVLVALLGVVGAFALWNFLVKPVQTEKTALTDQVQQKEQQLEQQRTGLANRAELEAQLDQALNNRIGVYNLLGDRASLDTLLLDINQQINNSNAAISDVINANLDQANLNQTLQSIGFTQGQIQTIRNRIADNPNIQNYYASKLFQFDPEAATLVQDGSLGPELDGKLERQQVAISFQALFPQTQAILRNLERLEPLVIVRDFNQSIAPPGSGVTEEDLEGLFRPLNTTATLEVLVPVVNPAEPPPPPAPPPAEGEAAPADGTVPPEGGEVPPAGG